MILSRIELAPDAASHEAFWRLFRDGYRLHQAVWSLFADHAERQRDFLYRLDMVRGRPRLLTLSQRPPLETGLWRVQPKPFAPKLAAGDRLRFNLRVNPVVTRQGKRHDVVMDAKAALKASGVAAKDRPRESELVQQAGSAWLLSRAEALGVEVAAETLRADGYEVFRFPKRDKTVSVASLDLSGLLVVRQPELFLSRLAEGIGKAKGFGCGLMLIARA